MFWKENKEKMVVLCTRSRISWISPYYKSWKAKNRGVTIFCPCFLSTHQGDHPQIYVSFSRHPNIHLDVFVFTRRAFFIKWEPWMYRCIRTFLYNAIHTKYTTPYPHDTMRIYDGSSEYIYVYRKVSQVATFYLIG